MPADFGRYVEDFFGGLTDPDGVARRRLSDARMPSTLDDRGAGDLYRGLASRATAERYDNPYSLDPTRESRAQLAAALEGMARGSNVAQAAGNRSMERLGLAGGQALGGARTVGERVATAQGLGAQSAEMADKVGQGAMQEEQQKMADYGQAVARMREGDQSVLGALTKGDVEQQDRMVTARAQMEAALEVIENAQAGAAIDYVGLLAKVSDEARAGSMETLKQLVQVMGSIAMIASGNPAGVASGVAGLASAGGGK